MDDSPKGRTDASKPSTNEGRAHGLTPDAYRRFVNFLRKGNMKKMKIYIAGAYQRKEELLSKAKELVSMGHQVVASWLVMPDEKTDDFDTHAEDWSLRDLEDIDQGEIFVAVTEEKESRYKRGGRHVEFGCALIKGKKMIVVGPRETTFHYLIPDEQVFPNWEEFIRWMKELTL